MKLWTIYNDYAATGEGRTIQALITYAEDEKDAIEKFSKTFDPFWAQGAEAKEGIVKNEAVKLLFSPGLLKEAQEMEGRANVKLFAEFHFNFS